MRPPGSIRARLFALLLPALLAGVLVSAALAYFVALHAASLAYDRSLLDPALAMSAHLKLQDGRVQLDLPKVAQQVLLIDTRDQLFFRVFDRQGTLAGDADLPAAPTPSASPQYFDATFRGQRVRVVALAVDASPGVDVAARATIEVAETVRKRDRLIREVLFASLLPSLAVAVATALLVRFGVASGLAPLNRLRQELAARSHRDLRPVPVELSPDETRPLIDAINELLARLQETIGMQQRFIANAAHQLRTPLAALLAQVELLIRSDLPPEHEAATARLQQTVKDTARLAGQLLTLARAEPAEVGRLQRSTVDLEALCEDLVQEWVLRSDERRIDLGFDLQAAVVQGDATLLRELVRNLLDNAINYTPSGGTVTLSVGGGRAAVIQVEDDGPGIPPQHRDRVTERFYRLEGTPGDGSGLGLAIVREIATAHGASLDITAGSGGRGTCVTVRFGADGLHAPAGLKS